MLSNEKSLADVKKDIRTLMSKKELEARFPGLKITFNRNTWRLQLTGGMCYSMAKVNVRRVFREALESYVIDKTKYDEIMSGLVGLERRILEKVHGPVKTRLPYQRPKVYMEKGLADKFKKFDSNLSVTTPLKVIVDKRNPSACNYVYVTTRQGKLDGVISIRILYRWLENNGVEFDHTVTELETCFHQNYHKFHYRDKGSSTWSRCYFVVGNDKQLHYDVL